MDGNNASMDEVGQRRTDTFIKQFDEKTGMFQVNSETLMYLIYFWFSTICLFY
jgi:hypothetical protein